jgi:hypothetical protein
MPEVVLPGSDLARLRDVSSSGKAASLVKTVTVRLRAVDITPGSCGSTASSDPVSVSLDLLDDDGQVIADQSRTGVVCTPLKKTHVKFPVFYEGPKNCQGSAVPAVKSRGDVTGLVSTSDGGALVIDRKITCAAAVPVEFSFNPPPNYHVRVGDTLTFTVSAARRGRAQSVTASGLPPGASFSGGTFSWTGSFVDEFDPGSHAVTFVADGESTVVHISATEYAASSLALVDPTGAEIAGDAPVPVGGQLMVGAQPRYVNPFGVPTIGGQGANGWNDFIWSSDATYVADFFSATNVAVVEGVGSGVTRVYARYTDAVYGEVSASVELDVLGVTSVGVSPANISMPSNATEPLLATATLEDGSTTSSIPFAWSSSNGPVVSVAAGSILGTANARSLATGAATITAKTTSGPVVSGATGITVVAPLRNQTLFGMDRQPNGNRVVSINTNGTSQPLATLLWPYDDEFCAASSHTNNQLLVGSFDAGTRFSEIQRISSTGSVTVVFTSNTITPLGDTIDVQALRYRPDGSAYLAMSEGQHRLSRIDPSNTLTPIGPPPGTDGYGPVAVAPFGNSLVYSGPWGVELLGQGSSVVGFADLVAAYDSTSSMNTFLARMGVSQPRLVAPDGDLWILDGGTGQLFRFEDIDGDGDHYEIESSTSGGVTTKWAVDDPGERILAGQLPIGFDQLHLNPSTGKVMAMRVVGSVPQRITMMLVDDLNGDGDVNDAGEQAVVFDAGAPTGTDIAEIVVKY